LEKEIVGIVSGAQMVIGAGIGTVVGFGNVVAKVGVVVGGPGIVIVGIGVGVGERVVDVGIIDAGLGGRVGVISWGVKTRYVGGGT
jgi:hypothetical protein